MQGAGTRAFCREGKRHRLQRRYGFAAYDDEGVFVRADASERGSLDFDVSAESAPEESRAALVYAGRFLEAGLASLVREYPLNVELKIQTD